MFSTNKKTLPSARTIIIALYIFLSLLYIFANLWINFKNNVMQWSYQSGKQALLQEILAEADETKCQPFTVFLKEKKINLVNTACLQKATAEIPVETPTAVPSEEKTAESASE